MFESEIVTKKQSHTNEYWKLIFSLLCARCFSMETRRTSKYKYSDTSYALERRFPEGRFPASLAIFHDLATVLVRAADTQSSLALHYSQLQGKTLDKSIHEKRGCPFLKRPDVCSRATAATIYRFLFILNF